MARGEIIFERAINNAVRELERDPEVGDIARDAREFFDLTGGRISPWAELKLDDPIQRLRQRYTGEELKLFENIVETLRLPLRGRTSFA